MEPQPGISQSRSAGRLLVESLRQAFFYWPVLVALWLGALLTAGLASLVPSILLYQAADNTIIREIANGIDAWQVVDLLGVVQLAQVSGEDSPAGLVGGVSGLVIGWLLLPLAGGVVSAFLYGGALLTYREAPMPFRWGGFFTGGWRWFGAFLLLGLVQYVLFLLLFLTFALFALQLGRLGDWGYVPALVLIVLAGALWSTVFELARVQTVWLDTRNPFRGLGAAFRLLRARPGMVLGFYALALLALGLLHVVFRLGILPLIPLEAFPLALIAQQVFIIVRLFARAVRLVGAGWIRAERDETPYHG